MLGALAEAAGFSEPAQTGPPPEPARFVKAGRLTTEGEPAPDIASKGGSKGVTADLGVVTEFIHFGRVHPDRSIYFPHSKYDDTLWPAIDQTKGRAQMFRAALQRETLLLHGQVSACRAMLAEYAESKGSFGDLANLASTAMSVLGGGGGGKPQPPKAEDLDPLLGRLEAAGGAINGMDVKYLDIHNTGCELHQVRSEFRAFLSGRLKPDTDMGMLPPLPDPAGGIVKWMFKGYDIYLHMYKTAAEKLQPAVNRNCYEIGMQALAARTTPVYQLWSKFEKPPEAAAPEDEPDNWLEEQKQKVEDKVDEAKDYVAEKKRAIQEFLGCAPEEQPPGQPYLEAVFAEAMKSPEWVADAAKTVIETVPGIVNDVVGEISLANATVLKGAYFRLMAKQGAPIDPGLLVDAGREAITRRVLTALTKLVGFGSFLQSKDKLVDVGGMGVSGASAGDPIVEWLNENVTANLDMIIQAACGNLAQQINDTRTAGGQPVGMEIFLARLPYWLAQMNHNLILPLWDLIADKLFGSVTSALGPILGTAGGALDKVRSTYKDANKAVDRVGNAMQDGIDQDKMAGAAVGMYEQGPEEWAKQQLFGDASAPPPAPKFPGGAREKQGTGIDVDDGQWSQAKHKWDQAGDPDKNGKDW